MGCIFEIHGDMGRFFDERIYKRELAHRHPGVQLEVPIEVTHRSFSKLQYIDVLVDGGAPFELKTVDAITPRHTAQLLNYLLLAELPHGKLVNLKKESVEHEFVNTNEGRPGFAESSFQGSPSYFSASKSSCLTPNFSI